MMAEFKVRGLPEEAVAQLDRSAAEAGMSREAYLRWLIRSAIDPAGMATISIHLEEPLPCGILDGSGQCGRPAHAASIWSGPVPGQWTMLPVCREHVERLQALYKPDKEADTGVPKSLFQVSTPEAKINSSRLRKGTYP